MLGRLAGSYGNKHTTTSIVGGHVALPVISALGPVLGNVVLVNIDPPAGAQCQAFKHSEHLVSTEVKA